MKQDVRRMAEDEILRFIFINSKEGKSIHEASIVYEMRTLLTKNAKLKINVSQITKVIADLKKQGFINREADEDFDRGFRLVLSPSGKLRVKMDKTS
jgi:DNA-binding MarR family transcriptional regulator